MCVCLCLWLCMSVCLYVCLCMCISVRVDVGLAVLVSVGQCVSLWLVSDLARSRAPGGSWCLSPSCLWGQARSEISPLHSALAVGPGRGPGQRSNDYSRIRVWARLSDTHWPCTLLQQPNRGNKLCLLIHPGRLEAPRPRWVGAQQAEGRVKDVAGLGSPKQPLLQPCWALLRRLAVCSGPVWPSGFVPCPSHPQRETPAGPGRQRSSGMD